VCAIIQEISKWRHLSPFGGDYCSQLHRVMVAKCLKSLASSVGICCALLRVMTLQTLISLVGSTLDAASEAGCAQRLSKACAESLKAAALGDMGEAVELWKMAASALPCTRCDGSGLIMHAKTTEFCGCN